MINRRNKCSISLYLVNISRYAMKPNGYTKKGNIPHQKTTRALHISRDIRQVRIHKCRNGGYIIHPHIF